MERILMKYKNIIIVKTVKIKTNKMIKYIIIISKKGLKHNKEF